jgi:hypothetical protein
MRGSRLKQERDPSKIAKREADGSLSKKILSESRLLTHILSGAVHATTLERLVLLLAWDRKPADDKNHAPRF